jgi:Holliday junction resolvase
MSTGMFAPTDSAAAGDSAPRGKNHYQTGRNFEWKIRDDLIANGFEVLRAAGSKGSSKIDLLAIKPGQLLFIQAKRSGALPPAEWDRLVEVAAWVDAVPILAANGPHGRGVVYTRLLAPKARGRRVQPCEPFLLDELAEVAAS